LLRAKLDPEFYTDFHPNAVEEMDADEEKQEEDTTDSDSKLEKEFTIQEKRMGEASAQNLPPQFLMPPMYDLL
jgi:hypothetical protein